jgi:hypothetical protein
VFELDAPDVDTGMALFRRDLNTYHQCRQSDGVDLKLLNALSGHANRICTYEQRHRNHISARSYRGTAAAIFSPEGINQLVRFAELMAQSRLRFRRILQESRLTVWL